MADKDSERGRRATFDRRTGAVHGSGAGAGGGNPGEDYDDDPQAGGGESEGGSGHPLPASDEARHDEIPEHLEREKGKGDDPRAAVQPAGEAVNPDGEPYAAAPADRRGDRD